MKSRLLQRETHLVDISRCLGLWKKPFFSLLLLLLASFQAVAQSVKVSGVVEDATGTPLIGVNIQESASTMVR